MVVLIKKMGRKTPYFFRNLFFFLLIFICSKTLKSQIRESVTYAKKKNHVTFYHLNIEIDPNKKFVTGKCVMNCDINNFLDTITLGLNSNYNVIKVLYGNKPLNFLRKKNEIIIDLNEFSNKPSQQSITVYYEGYPIISKNPPWDGGGVWSKDLTGNPFIGITCELEGAGIWWPAIKDISDKPDSLLFSITVPKGLYAVSNGNLRSTDTLNNKVCFNWFNKHPIINYNLTFYIGKYNEFNKSFISNGTNNSVSYYSLDNKQSNAEIYLNQIDTVLKIYEFYFGQYPFSDIGYKLVDAPYSGMEHQTAIAMGKPGISIFQLLGFNTKIGYVIVHETAHEWWGNSISIKSMSDLWINESFATYSESLFLEYLLGKEKAIGYINQDLDRLIKNEFPIYDSTQKINYTHDIYLKGSAVWNTFRHLLNNDSLWFSFLHAINKTYQFRSISTPELIDFINEYFKTDFTYFFNQYIYSKKIPLLEIKKDNNNLNNFLIRWSDCNPNFIMPLYYNEKLEKTFIYPTTEWKTYAINKSFIEDIKPLQNSYLIRIKTY